MGSAPFTHQLRKCVPSKNFEAKMQRPAILTIDQLIDFISQLGMLPLLNIGIEGWSADDAVDEECRYHTDRDGGWEWKL